MRIEEGRKRPADRTGKTAEQGQRGDGRSTALPIEAAEGGEGGIIEARAHAEPDHNPGQQKRRQGMRQR
jgi:hypothetical protein